MNKLIILFGALLIIFIASCEIQKDIVQPIEEPEENPIIDIPITEFGLPRGCVNDEFCTEDNCKDTGGTFLPNPNTCFCPTNTAWTNQGCDIEIVQRHQKLCEDEGKLWFNRGGSFDCREKDDNILQCEEVGGKWKMFSNGCVDNCGQKPRICTTVLTEGCDCGVTKCYGVEDSITPTEPSCIDDPFEPYATEQEACEDTEGTWEPICPTVEVDGEFIQCLAIGFHCVCPEGEIFTPFKGCIPKKQLEGLLSIISYG